MRLARWGPFEACAINTKGRLLVHVSSISLKPCSLPRQTLLSHLVSFPLLTLAQGPSLPPSRSFSPYLAAKVCSSRPSRSELLYVYNFNTEEGQCALLRPPCAQPKAPRYIPKFPRA
jgi:hypothetical protein